MIDPKVTSGSHVCLISPWPGTFHQAQEVHGQAPFMTSFVFNSFCPNLSSQLPTCRNDDYRRSVPSIVATTTMTPQSYRATGPLHPLSAVVANETLAIATGIDHGGVAHFTLAMMQSKKKMDSPNSAEGPPARLALRGLQALTKCGCQRKHRSSLSELSARS